MRIVPSKRAFNLFCQKAQERNTVLTDDNSQSELMFSPAFQTISYVNIFVHQNFDVIQVWFSWKKSFCHT